MNHMSIPRVLRTPVPVPQSAHCPRCIVRDACAPAGADASGAGAFDVLAGYRRRLERDETLLRRAQPLVALYVVRLGHLKATRPDRHGQPHVTAFHMAGDLIGLDAICAGHHACTVVALEDSEVCAIPYPEFQDALRASSQLMQRFHCAMSHEIVREQAALIQANTPAAERLAGFLLSLSARYAERGLSPNRFRLHMSRADIGNHLGLALESVSRLLTRFRDLGWIELDKRELVLRDPDKLEALLTAVPA